MNALARLARGTIFLLACLFPLVYVILACLRLGHPFELEWMEGSLVDGVARVAAGDGLYVKPSLEFTAYFYPPLYFWVSALVTKLFGVSFLSLRLVSAVASLGSGAWIVLLVRRLGGSAAGAWMGVALFAATYRLGGAWLDVARIDSLFLFLVLAGLDALLALPDHRGQALAGLLFFLGFLTKQSAAFLAAPIGVLLLFSGRGAGRVLFSVVFLGAIGLSTWLFDRMTEGWYSWHVFGLPSGHALEPHLAWHFFRKELALGVGPALAMGVWAWACLFRSKRRAQALLLGAFVIGALAASLLSRMHSGAYDNVVLPTCVGTALLFGLAWSEAGWRVERRPGLALGLALITAGQFLLLTYRPDRQLPPVGAVAAGQELLEQVKAQEGEVWLPYHGHLGSLAGKRRYAHVMAMDDVLRSGDGEVQAALRAEIQAALEGERFTAIFLDGWWMHEDELFGGYDRVDELSSDLDPLRPVTGMPTRPESVVRPADAGGEASQAE